MYDKYVEEVMKRAYGADRKIISRWKKWLKEAERRLSSLAPYKYKPREIKKKWNRWKDSGGKRTMEDEIFLQCDRCGDEVCIFIVLQKIEQ
jgi:hypothetical protein